MRLPLLLFVYWLTLSVSLIPGILQAQQPAQPQPAEKAAEAKPPNSQEIRGAQSSTSNRSARRGQARGLGSKIWWNQPKKVEELGLTVEQREKMDAVLATYFKVRRQSIQAKHEAFQALSDALVSGDSKATKAQAQAVADALSAPNRQQLDMMVEVVALLNTEQRKELISRYPRMLSRLWIRDGNLRQLVGGGSGMSKQ